jgi:hypothetical protein
MVAALREQLGDARASNFDALYRRARAKLVEHVLTQIPGTEPSLTDHGEAHVANVLRNIDHLVNGANVPAHCHFTGIEMYVLCLAALFHDTGNVFGRSDHTARVDQVYSWVRQGEPGVRQERMIVVRIAAAHGGKTATGNLDTLQDVEETTHLDGHQVRARQLAAVLRLADELAEGPQRTSQFMCDLHRYAKDSAIHHRYASIVDVAINRELRRVALTYTFEVYTDRGTTVAVDDFRQLLTYAYARLTKLEQERRYARHYATVLEPFQATTVTLNLIVDGQMADLELDQLELTDKQVPGGSAELAIPAGHPAYAIDALCAKVETAISARGAHV